MPTYTTQTEADLKLLAAYFKEQELACKASKGIRFAPGFAQALLSLRETYGKPMKLLSCCRSKAHNAAEGGAKNSFHIYDTGAGTCAIDVYTPSPAYRTELAKLALSMDWSLGVNRSFIHLDRRIDLGHPQIIFTY